MHVNIPKTTFVRDIKNRALLETDKRKAEDYKAKQKMFENDASIRSELNQLKSDMTEIKELLKGLVK
jgi:hypothetical protein